jgi:hypothetical protein
MRAAQHISVNGLIARVLPQLDLLDKELGWQA